MKNILVTGGAGFLGSHLCARLLAAGHRVLCLDNFFTGSEDNIRTLRGSERFQVIAHDVVAPVHFDHPIDQIYHLACPASPVHYQLDPVKTYKTCVLGTLNMLELAKANNARLFIASTSEVYGDPLQHPQQESYWGHVNPIGIRSCYDEGKRGAETICMDYHRQYEVDIRIGRIFNTYGPNMHPEDGRVVSNFILQALRGEPITLYGDGSQTRSFCYVDDLIEVFVRMVESDRCGVLPINIGNPDERTVRQLAELIIRMTGSSSPLVEKPLPSDDPVRRCPDITRATTLLGWKPVVTIESGLEKTIAYFQSRLAASEAA